MSTTEEFLQHYGVKGMKWGVHNGEIGMNGSKAERKVSKKESKLAYKDWKKEVGGEKVANEIFQTASKTFAPAVKMINNDPMFKGKDLSKDRRLAREYDTVTSAVFNQHLAAASITRTTTNTGRAMIYQFDRNLGAMRAIESQLVLEQSSDSGYPDFKATLNSFGQIVELEPDIDNSVSHLEKTEDFFAHYGVKGMKWGKSGAGASASGSTAKKAKDPASDDAARVGQIHAKVKSNRSSKSLSNKELQEAITRMNLEQQYSRMTGGLDKTRREKAAAFVRTTVLGSVKNTVSTAANAQVKDAIEKQTNTGRYDPLSVTKREADMAAARNRLREERNKATTS